MRIQSQTTKHRVTAPNLQATLAGWVENICGKCASFRNVFWQAPSSLMSIDCNYCRRSCRRATLSGASQVVLGVAAFICIVTLTKPAVADEAPVGGGASDAKPVCSETLDVHVIESFDHDPIGAVSILVNHVVVGTTDGHGRFALGGLCHGQTLHIDAIHGAYEPATRTITVREAASVELELNFAVEDYTVETKAAPAVNMRSTAIISDEALERKRGQSLAETLADVPGVSQLRSGSGLAKPIVRGQFGRRLPIIVDGVRHRAQDWGVDHAPEIDPSIADRISVVRGASGVRYGPDAIGGVLIIDPPDVRRVPGVEGQTHIVGMSNGLGGNLMSRVQAVPAAMPALTLALEGSFKRVQAPETPQYALDNTGEGQWTAGATVSYRASDATYQLSFRHLAADLGICSCYRMESPADFFAQAQQRRPYGSELYTSELKIERPYQAIAHELAIARARWSVGALGTITGTYAFQYDDRKEYDIVRQAVRGPQFSFRLWTHDLDATLEHKPVHFSDHHHLIGSVGAVGMAQVHSYTGLQLVPDHQAGSAGVFATERLLADDYEIEIGLRYDFLARTAALERNDFLRIVSSGQLNNDTCGEFNDNTASVNCDSTYHTVSASLGGMRRFTEALSGKLDLSMASRPPNPDEQYINGTAPSFPVFGLGRPNLGAETSYSASTTAIYGTPRLTGEVSAFGSYISDYIYFAPAVGADGKPVFDVLIRGAFPRFVTRPVDAVFYGADGSLAARPTSWLEAGGQASIVRAKNVTDNSFLAFVPSDSLRTSITLKRKTIFGLSNGAATVVGNYTARQSRFDPTADLAPPPDAYFIIGGTLQAETHVGNQTVKVALQGSNVSGRRYREYTSLLRYFADQPGRQLMLRVSMAY